MPDRLKLACWLGSVRSIVGVLLASFLVYKLFFAEKPVPEVFASDRRLFLVLAIVLAVLALLRLTIVVGSVLSLRWVRRLGLGLAIFDCANLILFPLSTAFGLHGLVVFRHADTVHFFGSRPRS